MLRKPFLKSEITFSKSENKSLGDREAFSVRKAFSKSENKMISDNYIIYNQVYMTKYVIFYGILLYLLTYLLSMI